MSDQIGRFQVRKRLGGGGFGEVFLAEDPSIGRLVAIKVFRPKDENLIAFATSSNTEGLDILRTRFLNEAKILAALENAVHVVNVLEYGELPDGAPYYVMPYLPHSLADELGRDVFDVKALEELDPAQRPRALPMDRALAIAGQMLRGLTAAHGRGLIHRDIKPANIMLTEDGDVRIADFGIAKAPDGQHSTVSHLGMGSRNYMAPEQRESAKHVDARADVYAMGRVIYRMLTGKLPVGRFADPDVAVPALGKAMNAVILSALSEDRDDRPADASEFLQRFEAALSGVGQQDSSEHSGTWVGDQGLSGLRDELNPLRDAIIAQVGQTGFIPASELKAFRAMALVGDLDETGLTALIADTIASDRALQSKSKLCQLIRQEVGKAGKALDEDALGIYARAAEAAGWSREHLHHVMHAAVADLPRADPAAGRAEAYRPSRPAPERPSAQRASPSSTASQTTPPSATTGNGGRWLGIAITALLLGGGGYGVYAWRQAQIAAEQHERAISASKESEAAAWRQATQADTADAYAHFLKLWPQGDNAAEARTRQAQREEQARLSQLSDAQREQERIKAIQRDLNALGYTVAENGDADARTVEAIKAFEKASKLVITGSPDAVLAKALSDELTRRDEAAWSKATKADTEAAYSDYRNSYPTGRHADEIDARLNAAQQRIADQQAESARLAEEQRKAEEARRTLVTAIQTELKRLGNNVPTDGTLSSSTTAVIKVFEKATRQPETGEPSKALLASLKATERWPAPQPGDRFRDCDNCPEMVVIPSGRFEQGSPSHETDREDNEGPVHTVQVPSFALGRTEVTRGEFRRFVEATGYRTDAEKNTDGNAGCYAYKGGVDFGWKAGTSWRDPGFAQEDSHPVVCVSWNDAKAYVGWLKQETGQSYRLPSESELEYANRAGTTTPWPWGSSGESGCGMANYADAAAKGQLSGLATASCNDGHVFTAPVGSYRANAFGLHDTAGNVIEWTEDCWNDSYAGAPNDGRAWTSGDCGRRFLRGGSWFSYPLWLRSAFRGNSTASNRYTHAGFRLARTL